MPDLYCPGAIRISGGSGSGAMAGGLARATWHSYEAPYNLLAAQGMQSLIRAGNDLHICFNPITGEYAQGLPANVGGKGLVNLSGGGETNRMGVVNIQVEVVAYAERPFTLDITPAGLKSLHIITDWMQTWGIPKEWPDGPPVAYASSYPPSHYPRSVTNWRTRAGHYAHSQVPENTHGDPGAVDITKFFTASVPAVRPTGEDRMTLIRHGVNDVYWTNGAHVAHVPNPGVATELAGYTGQDLTKLPVASAGVMQWLQDSMTDTADLASFAVKVDALTAKVDVLSISAIAAAVVAALPAPSTGVFPTVEQIATAVNDEIARRQQA